MFHLSGNLLCRRSSVLGMQAPLYAFIVSSLLGLSTLSARPSLPPHFGPHMVLQCDQQLPLWGRSEPGEKITLSFAGQSRTFTADAQGAWSTSLDPLCVSASPRSLTVSGDKPDSSGDMSPLVLDDILVGEVWLCSGQSNMDMTVAMTPKYRFAGVNNEAAEVAAANHPLIRMFTGTPTCINTPQYSVPGLWRACTPNTVREFSAAAYFFARRLRQDLDVPVGLVTLSYGASTAQAWIRREAITADPLLKPVLDTFDAQVANHVAPSEAEIIAWKAEVEKARSLGLRAPKQPKSDPVLDQHNPTVLFNGMVNPVVPMALRGILWYQGESITAPKELFPRWNETLIKDWRKLWGRDLPFYFVQLASHKAASNSPTVREQQALALALPSTGMAVAIDIGDRDNVHPKNKQEVGARLALIALAKTYGKEIEYSGPVLSSSQREGSALRLLFTHAKGGLVVREGNVRTLEIAGPDGKFFPAEAVLDGDSLLVSNSSIQNPRSVRYAWAAYPEGSNLYNQAGLPAAPFRTDVP